MRILLTNDDGVNARGLALLEGVARRLADDIWIVAPSEEQSGAGHSLTLTQPVRLRRHGEQRSSVTGTPTDAVMLGLAHAGEGAPPGAVAAGARAPPVRRRRPRAQRSSVTGTPTDAVMLALAHVMKDAPPDVILSGINRGANLAEDVTYSGTVSAAMEGALAGGRPVALCQAVAGRGPAAR